MSVFVRYVKIGVSMYSCVLFLVENKKLETFFQIGLVVR